MKWPCPSGPYSTHTTLHSVHSLSGAAKGEGQERDARKAEVARERCRMTFASSAVVPSLPRICVAGAETAPNCTELSIEGKSS